jgi:leader peptidase (prepilin peptidase)/N-methyltransferase
MGRSVLDVFLGATVGAAVLYFVAVYYEALPGREGLGGGAVNLLALLGGFLGWQALPFLLLASSFIGAAVGLAILLPRGRDLRTALPFGPFLCGAALLYLAWGDRWNSLLRL